MCTHCRVSVTRVCSGLPDLSSRPDGQSTRGKDLAKSGAIPSGSPRLLGHLKPLVHASRFERNGFILGRRGEERPGLVKVQLRMPRQDRFWDLAHPTQERMHLVEARCFVDVFDEEGRPVKLLCAQGCVHRLRQQIMPLIPVRSRLC